MMYDSRAFFMQFTLAKLCFNNLTKKTLKIKIIFFTENEAIV